MLVEESTSSTTNVLRPAKSASPQSNVVLPSEAGDLEEAEITICDKRYLGVLLYRQPRAPVERFREGLPTAVAVLPPITSDILGKIDICTAGPSVGV